MNLNITNPTILTPNEKNYNFYVNSSILFFGFFIVLYILKKNNKNVRDENSYDWTKYNIQSDLKVKNKKSENKDKTKKRNKEFSKGTGFIKDEHKFKNDSEEPKSSNFLNYEEANNLQDMINYAAAKMNQNQMYPIESLYSQVLSDPTVVNITNEKLDNAISELLKSSDIDEKVKIKKILELYSQLIKMKNKNLSESTYVCLVELFMRNDYLEYASYFLCQMDKLKIKIPRNLLDLFLDYSINKKIFEQKEEVTFKNNTYDSDKLTNKREINFNKFDQYDPKDELGYVSYFQKRNYYQKRNDIHAIFSKLKVDAKPFYPGTYDNLKSKLSEIDPDKVKEFVPKNFRVVKKNDTLTNESS